MNEGRIAKMVRVADSFSQSYSEHSRLYPHRVKEFWKNFKSTTAGVNAACLEEQVR